MTLQNSTLNKSTPIPLYYQLKLLILKAIDEGEYKPGDMIPTEFELEKIFGISRTTVRQAITELVYEDRLYRINSKGTFVSAPKLDHQISTGENYYSNFHSFEDEIAAAGHVPHTEIISIQEAPTPPEMTKLGYSSPSGKVIKVVRCRYSDDEPFGRIVSQLSYDHFKYLLQSDDLKKYTIGEILNRDPETKVTRIVRTFEAIAAGIDDEKILKVRQGTPIYYMYSQRYHGDELMDISGAYFTGKDARFTLEMNLIPDETK